MTQALTSQILMIRPVRFAFNTQTAESNSFQNPQAIAEAEKTQAQALQEFDAMVANLRQRGVEVWVYNDTPEPHTPDSIFPNNWVSFHQDGKIILYPMYAPNRRLERRTDIIEDLKGTFAVQEVVDLSHFEAQNHFLEGTGSLIFDRVNRIAYACLSPRADKMMLKMFGEKFDYEMIIFDALDRQGKPIYHTNVVMCLGDNFAVICDECIPNAQQREIVLDTLSKTGKEVVSITMTQLENFAGNMLNITTIEDEHLLVMSERAYRSLNAEQIATLEKYATMVYSSLATIENNGGGSARCMMAEVFLPKM
ncbi:MAG: arginine deiminase-related protein [Microscillaceae bacterium]|nr:arginine deiminase-related protein [Microscillaceae bacterium]